MLRAQRQTAATTRAPRCAVSRSAARQPRHARQDAGSGTSVVDATTSRAATGSLKVDCCAHPRARRRRTRSPAQVRSRDVPGHRRVRRRDDRDRASGSVEPRRRPDERATWRSRSANPADRRRPAPGARQPPPLTVDSRAIGNEVFAHADQLAADPANPATLTLRFSQADVMATPLAEVQVGAHQRRGRDGARPPTASAARCPPGATCVHPAGRPVADDPEHLRHRAHHPDLPVAPAPPGPGSRSTRPRRRRPRASATLPAPNDGSGSRSAGRRRPTTAARP